MKTYALICAYNEEKTVNDVIKDTLKYVDKIIFVNDGSTDNTSEVVKEKFGENKKIIIISYEKNKGKGYALKSGFRRFINENGDVLVTLDADKQHDPNQIPLLELMVKDGYSDVIIGSRYSKVSGYPRIRVFFNMVSIIAILLTIGGIYADVASGFRAYSKKAVRKILPHLTLEHFGIELETLKFLANSNLRVSTIPVDCSYKTGKKDNFKRLAKGYIDFMWRYKKDAIKKILQI